MSKERDFYNTLYPVVVQAMREEGIDPAWAPITTSQAMIESSWGKSPASAINNFFGMKAAPGQKSKSFSTREGYGKNTVRIKDNFLAFDSLEEGVKAGVRRLKNKFKAYEGTPSAAQYVQNINRNPKALYFTGDPALYTRNLAIISGSPRASLAHQNLTQQERRIEKATWDDYASNYFAKPVSTSFTSPSQATLENTMPTLSRVPDGNMVQMREERVDPAPSRAMRALETIQAYNRLASLFDFANSQPATQPYAISYPFMGNFSDGGSLRSKSWDDLSPKEKSDVMQLAIREGITDLEHIKGAYNSFAEGGSIPIKPENRGKFTALKERTGHSSTWFKENGTPEQRKMATFALNAAKWHHAYGGNLYAGNNPNGQQMKVGKAYWEEEAAKPTLLQNLAAFNQQRAPQVTPNIQKALSRGQQIAQERITKYPQQSMDVVRNMRAPLPNQIPGVTEAPVNYKPDPYSKYYWEKVINEAEEKDRQSAQGIIDHIIQDIREDKARLAQKDKAISRANRGLVPPRYNSTAQLQEALFKMGAFEGIKDKRGRDVTYNSAVDGIRGRMTNAAIRRAQEMGYHVDVNSGTISKVPPISVQEASIEAAPQYTGLDAIVNHKVKYGVQDPYVVVDKRNNRMNVMRGRDILESHEVTTSLNKGDGWYPLRGHEGLVNMPRTTGAGVFTLKGYPTSEYPRDREQKQPMFVLYAGDTNSTMGLHDPVNALRRSLFNNTPNDNRVSYGCISPPAGVVGHLYNDQVLHTGDSLYILPEIEGNYLYEKDGKLQMYYGNKNPKTFTTDVGFTDKFRYNKNK